MTERGGERRQKEAMLKGSDGERERERDSGREIQGLRGGRERGRERDCVRGRTDKAEIKGGRKWRRKEASDGERK